MEDKDNFNFIISNVKDIVTGPIKERIENGYIYYERQLQAELYHYLIPNLVPKFNIWVEQVISLKELNVNSISPDMIITLNNEIISIIELKIQVFGKPQYKMDFNKFFNFDQIAKNNPSLFSNLILRKPNDCEDVVGFNNIFSLNENYLSLFIAIGERKCDAFSFEDIKLPNNFFGICGYRRDTNLVFDIKNNRK